MTKDKQNEKNKISSVLAKSEDGTIQITFTIPHDIVSDEKKTVLKELAKEIEIPGFRKGMAPVEKVEEKVSKETLYEKILNKILPLELSNAFKTYNIKPVIYPKLELLSSKEGENWQIRITTCELPEIDLGDYKKAISEKTKVKAIWTPEKGDTKEKETKLTQGEKESEVIKTLVEIAKIKIPKPLKDEEVNSRLSRLLEQIEKLGLTLDNYLASIGKTSQTLRDEYEKEAVDSITIELALNKIANEEKIEIKEEEIDKAINATSGDPNFAEKLRSPEQRRAIASILRRREALEKLTNLIQ
ncbi:MAG TPA: trigger factor [Patescibacteria group bacterium]|nr:trigger factor [Patescibacteria group bacterium]